MGTGFRGAFVISWSQTELDGLDAAPIASLSVGAAWSWRGDAVRVDGPSDLLRLDEADGEADLRKRAARMVRRLVGAAVTGKRDLRGIEVTEPLMDSSIIVTDGARTYTITLIEPGNGAPPLLLFIDELPPRNTDLWVVHHALQTHVQDPMGPSTGGVICFTPGTRILTPDGARLVEDLREGDRVMTRDSGAQDVEWIGSRRMTGARLFAMPKLRPIRIRAGALGVERPEEELLVSPEHRMLVKGAVAQALFNTPEVLVAAKDLINDHTIAVDTALKEVTYIHLLLPKHEILWANGVETESFHPANAALSTLADEDRERLLARHPAMAAEPARYGEYARRNLSRSEAAILNHEVA
ncbi:MAG: Hint domain-containing protein [Paracoccaceae bacterium]